MKVIHFQVKGRDYYVNPDKLVEIRHGVYPIVRWQVTASLCECETADGEIEVIDNWTGIHTK